MPGEAPICWGHFINYFIIRGWEVVEICFNGTVLGGNVYFSSRNVLRREKLGKIYCSSKWMLFLKKVDAFFGVSAGLYVGTM